MKNLRLKKILRACRTVTLMFTLVLSLIIFQGCAGKSELNSSGANRRVARRTARKTAQRVERRTDRRDNRPPQPGDNYWWNGKKWIKLPSAPKNTVWVPGHYNKKDNWVPGHFKYRAPVPKGQVWVTGHWKGNTWIPGHFRPSVKKGYVWVPGHYKNNLIWVKGHWKAVR